MDSVTPDEPRRAPIRWHVATVRDARTESPTARTLVLDGVFDLAAWRISPSGSMRTRTPRF